MPWRSTASRTMPGRSARRDGARAREHAAEEMRDRARGVRERAQAGADRVGRVAARPGRRRASPTGSSRASACRPWGRPWCPRCRRSRRDASAERARPPAAETVAATAARADTPRRGALRPPRVARDFGARAYRRGARSQPLRRSRAVSAAGARTPIGTGPHRGPRAHRAWRPARARSRPSAPTCCPAPTPRRASQRRARWPPRRARHGMRRSANTRPPAAPRRSPCRRRNAGDVGRKAPSFGAVAAARMGGQGSGQQADRAFVGRVADRWAGEFRSHVLLAHCSRGTLSRDESFSPHGSDRTRSLDDRTVSPVGRRRRARTGRQGGSCWRG